MGFARVSVGHRACTGRGLDRLLEDDGLHFSGVSGTSAGALNAAVMASGYKKGGRDGDWRQFGNTELSLFRAVAVQRTPSREVRAQQEGRRGTYSDA